ncbi:NfeD family protein [Shimia biformata]|uniref:NfeD family protein n=1 Tax=Shimia biformata TaxID=1294299 RepID=UPI001951D08B|nr:hypothetical protein [Shimia biformata]
MSDPIWTIWWVWAAAALILAILEVLAPGYVFLGFAIGAGAVGLLLANTGLSAGLPLLLLIFAALSLVAWFALKQLFPKSTGSVKTFDEDIND